MAALPRRLTVAVVGAGVSGCVCASTLAERGVPVMLFDQGRGPGGRMSHRRETTADGKEFQFDHGAQYFSVKTPAVQDLVDRWLAKGIIKEWGGKFGSYDRQKMTFEEETFEDESPKYVGVPGMNSLCKALSRRTGVKTTFGCTVASLRWQEDKETWHLKSKHGDDLGVFAAVVVSDKTLASERFTALHGLPPPLQNAGVPSLYGKLSLIPSVPVFTVMVAFARKLDTVPFDRFTIEGSTLLAGAVRVSSKPGRLTPDSSEAWVLHSAVEFAKERIGKEGFSKPSSSSLDEIASTLLKEFQEIVPEATNPLFLKSHRWGSAFPREAAAPESHCLMEPSMKIAACGDYCVGPRIEYAIVSGLAAATNIEQILKPAVSRY